MTGKHTSQEKEGGVQERTLREREDGNHFGREKSRETLTMEVY